MIDSIFTSIMGFIGQVLTWFQDILTATGSSLYVYGVIVGLIFFRLIIWPLFGGGSRAGSDSAKKRGEGEE